jgi:hypothetical protein
MFTGYSTGPANGKVGDGETSLQALFYGAFLFMWMLWPARELLQGFLDILAIYRVNIKNSNFENV